MKGWYGNRYSHSLASKGVKTNYNIKKYHKDRETGEIKESWKLDNIDSEKIEQIIDAIETIEEQDPTRWGCSCVWISEYLVELSGGIKVDGWMYDVDGNLLWDFEDMEHDLDDCWYHSWVVLKDGTIIDASALQFLIDSDKRVWEEFVGYTIGERYYNDEKFPKHMIAIIPKDHPNAQMYSSHRKFKKNELPKNEMYDLNKLTGLNFIQKEYGEEMGLDLL